MGRRIVERISIVETRAMFPGRASGRSISASLAFRNYSRKRRVTVSRTYLHVKFRISFPNVVSFPLCVSQTVSRVPRAGLKVNLPREDWQRQY